MLLFMIVLRRPLRPLLRIAHPIPKRPYLQRLCNRPGYKPNRARHQQRLDRHRHPAESLYHLRAQQHLPLDNLPGPITYLPPRIRRAMSPSREQLHDHGDRRSMQTGKLDLLVADRGADFESCGFRRL